MSNQAIDLLIECELLRSDGSIPDINNIPNEELSRRLSYFINARQESIYAEIEQHPADSKLNAQFSTWSSKFSKEKTLSSLLIYNKIVLDDPLVSSNTSMSLETLKDGLEFYSWLHPLIRAGFVTIYPIGFYERPSKNIPVFSSEDAFKSAISPEIHDYAHSNVILKSVVMDEKGRTLILRESASVKRRTALAVSFKNDRLYSGVGLFKFTTMENTKVIGNKITYDQHWDRDGTLSEQKFNQWAYQATNQAIMARLKAICTQTLLAQELGHTYITESEFESTLLSLSNTQGSETISPCVRFLDINENFLNIESPLTIVELRSKYHIAFERFNNSLLAVSDELHGIKPQDFEKKCQTLFLKEIMPQIDEIRSAVGQIGSGFLKGTLASFCGIGLAIGTGSTISLVPSLLASASLGLTETLPALREFQLQKKRPGYIWHRIAK